MINKRGFELGWSTIVLMILAIFILLILVAFLGLGSRGFMETIKNYFSSSNVDSVISGCNSLADTNSQYGYCCEKKEVRYNSGKDKVKEDLTCFEAFNKSFISGKIKELDCEGINC